MDHRLHTSGASAVIHVAETWESLTSVDGERTGEMSLASLAHMISQCILLVHWRPVQHWCHVCG